jgi:hypothetical protein
MTYLKIENNVVVSAIEADSDFISSMEGLWVENDVARIGWNYDPASGTIYPPQPFPSWTLDQTTLTWAPPVPRPTDGQRYRWNEEAQSWDVIPPRTPKA